MRPALAAACAVLALAGCSLAAEPTGSPSRAGSPSPGEPPRPNILVVVTDDMRVDGLQAMPVTVEWLMDNGRSYPNAFATTPLCCPSRASLFTGLYAHNHGVLKNHDSHDLETSRTVQAGLQANGYRTGLVGKYLNSWSVEEDPPHFDRWASYSGRYYGKPFNVDGEPVETTDYSTYHMAKRAKEILGAFENTDDTPWFLYVATVAPHAPFTVAPQHKGATVPVLTRQEIGLAEPVDEENTADKPDIPGRDFSLENPRKLRRKQWRTLLSVDDLMRHMKQALADLDESRDTLVLFTSDQGLLQGEHDLYAKRLPYTESIAVPLLLRWPGRMESGVDDRIVANVDIAATIEEVTGISVPGGTDGTSLLTGVDRSALFVEQLENWRVGIPDWASVRSDEYQYIEYYSRDRSRVIAREYYDLVADPWQLRNLFGDEDPSNNPDHEALAALIAEQSECRGEACLIQE